MQGYIRSLAICPIPEGGLPTFWDPRRKISVESLRGANQEVPSKGTRRQLYLYDAEEALKGNALFANVKISSLVP